MSKIRKSFSIVVSMALLTGAVVFVACNKENDKDDKTETSADLGTRKAQELCGCFKRSSQEEMRSCVSILNENAEYLKYEGDADFQKAFDQEREKCDAETPDWY